MSGGRHPENAMSCKGIRLVFAKGSVVVKLPGGIPDDHVGPVLADLVACAPGADGFHKVPVKEIPTAMLGAPLKHFLAEGKLPPSTRADASLLLAPSYKAAERLDVMGLVRAVERAAMAAVASGDVSLEDLAAAFAGCPRVAALCENYLALPGVRAPPPFKISTHLPELAAAHGALIVVGTTPSRTARMYTQQEVDDLLAAALVAQRERFDVERVYLTRLVNMLAHKNAQYQDVITAMSAEITRKNEIIGRANGEIAAPMHMPCSPLSCGMQAGRAFV